MDGIMNTVSSNIAATYQPTAAAKSEEPEKAADKPAEAAAETKGALGTEAATFEKSTGTENKTDTPVKKTEEDRSAIIAQMKADMEKQTSQLLEIVRKTLSGQAGAVAIAEDDESLWQKLAKGDFTVDAATKAQAEADIADDGYWGVDKTSDRILDFAKALSGNDPEKADKLLDAFKKGYEEATKTWGQDLPDISKRTYDAVLSKFEDWKNSSQEQTADAAQTAQATQQIAAGENISTE